MLKMIFFDEDPDEVLKEEDIRTTTGTRSRQEIERIDFRDTEEVNIDFRILVILRDLGNMLYLWLLQN